MKAIFLLFCFILDSVATTQPKAESKCNILSYKSYIYKPGIHNCNLRFAEFQVEFRGGKFRGVNLQGANL